MSSIDPAFEARLQTRLRAALGTMDGPHPEWTASPAARRVGRVRPAPKRRRWPLRVLAVAAVLALGGGAISAIGSLQPRRGDISPPAVTIPSTMTGLYAAQVGFPGPNQTISYAWYSLDFAADVMLFGPSQSRDPEWLRDSGAAAPWAGHAVSLTVDATGSGVVAIEAPPPCGAGSYAFRSDGGGLAFRPLQDGCADRVTYLTLTTWIHLPVELVPGDRYASWQFTEPFRFVVPREQTQPPLRAIHWLAAGRLLLSSSWSSVMFIDDLQLPVEPCDPSRGSLPDLPATPAAFEEWLRSNAITIRARDGIRVNGRTAVRYDTESPGCPGVRRQAPEIDVGGRYYLIPTPHDTILVTAHGDTETELRILDDLVQSMTFD